MTRTSARTAAPLRWAILGTGGVARKFVLDLHAGGGGRAVIVASRDPAKAQAFARSLGIEAAASDYAEAVAADVDAVYVATPPELHEEHAGLAIAAARPVLVEKPFAADAPAAMRIAEAARTKGVFCMEAMWTRFQPAVARARAALEAGDIGEIRSFEAGFLGANVPQPGTTLFDRDGGGALLHRGIYPLSLARHLLGPVDEIRAFGRLGETGADEDCALLLRHASGALSSLRASLRSAAPDRTVIAGTSGTILLEGPVYRPLAARRVPTHPAPAVTGQSGPRRFEAFRESAFGLKLSRTAASLRAATGRGGAQHLAGAPQGNGYRYQALAVAEAIRLGRTEDPCMPLGESVELIALIDEVRNAWRATSDAR